jgi:hypothetical protein
MMACVIIDEQAIWYWHIWCIFTEPCYRGVFIPVASRQDLPGLSPVFQCAQALSTQCEYLRHGVDFIVHL